MEKFVRKRPFPSDNCADDAPKSKILADIDLANRKVFGNTTFRDKQIEIIEEIMKNSDVFVIMPTGGGKSLCYQVNVNTVIYSLFM